MAVFRQGPCPAERKEPDPEGRNRTQHGNEQPERSGRRPLHRSSIRRSISRHINYALIHESTPTKPRGQNFRSIIWKRIQPKAGLIKAIMPEINGSPKPDDATESTCQKAECYDDSSWKWRACPHCAQR